MKTYLFSTRPKLPTQSASRIRLSSVSMVLFLFSIVAILTVNSCTTDFNAAQTNKQTNKHSNVATLAETRDAPCGPTGTPPDGCKDTMIYNFPVLVAGGCTILVDYKLRKCPTGFSLSGINLHYTASTQCDLVQNHFLDLYNQGNYTAASTDMNALFSWIATTIEMHELNSYTIPYCDENFNITTQVFASSCLQLCLTEDDRGNPLVIQAECGNGCCSRNSIYCINRETKLLEMYHQNGPIPSCLSNDVCNSEVQTQCTVNCDRILYKDIFNGF